MNLYNLAKAFKPTANRVGAIQQGGLLLRPSKKWLATYAWMMQKDWQPEFLQRTPKSDNKLPSKAIKSVLKGSKQAKHKLELTNDLKLISDKVAVVLKNNKYKQLVNVYYISMLDKLTHGFRYKIEFFQEKENKPIYGKIYNKTLVVIMPIKE